MAHTPGPWVGFVDRSDGTEVMDILPAGRDGEVASGIRNGADADLIIAAPDLLAVVQELVEGFDGGHIRMESEEIGEIEVGIPPHPWHEELLHYARQALAKATGTH